MFHHNGCWGAIFISKCNLIHISRHAIDLPLHPFNSIDTVEHGHHSHDKLTSFSQYFNGLVPTDTFYLNKVAEPSSLINVQTHSSAFKKYLLSLSEVRRLVDRVRRHGYGHASYSDIKMLLM